MLPKLKGDTIFIPMSDGISFRNNQGSFKIKGKVVYRWVESLAPYLNGEHTLAKITAGLSPEKQAMVTDLVNTLLTHGFLKDLSQDLPHHLSQTERATYAAEIAFIDSFCDSAAARFERFREQQVLLIGSGLTLTGLVKALLKCGLRQVAIITTSECETNTRRYQEYLYLFHKGDPRQTLREIDAPDWKDEAEVQAALQLFDTILHVSDRPMLARANMLNRLCVTQKKNLLQATIVDDHAWIGPLVRETQEGCWECAMLRLQGNLTNMQKPFPTYAFQDQTTAPVSRFVASPTAAFVTNLLSFEVFKHLTEAGPVETRGNLLEVDLETLRMQKHPFMPHPLCQTCSQPTPRSAAEFLETIQQLEQGEPSDQDLFSKQVIPCFETRLGLFSSLDEGELVQLPLSVCQAVVSNPMPQEQLANPPAVLGFGTSFDSARKIGAERACEIYAASVVDRRRLPSAQDVGTQTGTNPVPTISAERFLSAAPLTEVKDWTWAIDLSTGQACLVPAPLVYPVLRGLSALGDAGLGISLGMSWAEAVSQGLLNVCKYLTITRFERAQYPQVDLATIALSPEGTRLHHILEQIGESVTIYDVTGSLQVPTFAICQGDKTVAYGAHLDVAQALQEGFEQALLYNQLSGEQILVDNLPFVPALPVALHDNTTAGARPVPMDAAQEWSDRTDAPQEWGDRKSWLQETLQKQGWSAFAVPLDHDPVLRQIHPYIVHVLVARA